MKPLQPIPQCVDCLMSLAKDIVTLAASENPGLVEKAAHITRNILEDTGDTTSSSPQIANRILREIKQITGIEDPYSDFKAQEMAQARKIFSRVKNYVDQNLRSRASLAALGNSLDFFKNSEQALAEIPNLFNNRFFLLSRSHRSTRSFFDEPDRRSCYILPTTPVKFILISPCMIT